MKKLNIGILVDDTKLEYYKIEILKEIQKLEFCTISQFITVEKKSANDSGLNHLFYRAFNKLDAKLFGRGTKYLGLESINTFIDSVSNEKDLDVVINLSSFESNFKTSARYGFWQYVYNSKPNAYWEVVNDDPFTEVRLESTSSKFGEDYVLSTFRTMTDRKSMIKNRDFVAWRSHMMVIRELKRLARDGDGYFEDKKKNIKFDYNDSNQEKRSLDLQFSFSDDKKLNPPKNCQMILATCKLLKKYATFSFRKFFPMDRWFILYAQNKNGEINQNLNEYKRYYSPSKEYFCADPFVVDEGDKSYLFFEELDYATAKGYLKVAEYDEKSNSFKESQMVLVKDYHLSYPNVFKYEDKYYMIPESYENQTVDLFEAIDFPTKWEKKRTLLKDVSAVDATLYYKDDKWWMFVNIAEKNDFSMNDELYIYYCENFLTDNLIPHVNNPVVSDTLSARPAGNLIERNNILYRPAQDCSGLYGRKIVINEVEILNELEYKESAVGEISADFSDDLVAVHTLNNSKRLTVIDAIKSR